MSETLAIVPSRGRPENIQRLVNSLADTKSEVKLVVGIDMDDPCLEQYMTLERNYDYWIDVCQNGRERFAPTLNRVAKYWLEPEHKYIYWCGDDHLPITPEWDRWYRQVIDKMGGVGVVYGNDLVMGEAIATQLMFSRNIYDTLGYAVPPGFIHLFVDNYFMELGRAIDRLEYLPSVIVQHLHPCAGGAAEDQTYREANSPANWSNDQRVFEEWKRLRLPCDIEKLTYLL